MSDYLFLNFDKMGSLMSLGICFVLREISDLSILKVVPAGRVIALVLHQQQVTYKQLQ